MKNTSISNVQENLGTLLEQVRRGEAFMIFDQDKPVARLEPVGQIQIAEADKVRLEMLAAKGLVQPAQTALDWGSLPDPVNPIGNASAVEKLLADREGL